MDRMVITGTDGKDKYLVDEGGEVQDAVLCQGIAINGHHTIHVIDLRDEDMSPCFHCGMTLKAIRNKGEKVVH